MDYDPAEAPFAQPRRSLGFYLVLLFVVAPIWSVTPLSWGYVLYSIKSLKFSLHGGLLFVAASLEVAFSIYYYSQAVKISRPVPHPRTDPLELQRAFKRVLLAGLSPIAETSAKNRVDGPRHNNRKQINARLKRDDPRAVDFRQCIRTWFGRAPWSSIRREQMYAWLHWSISDSTYSSHNALSKHQRTALDEALSLVEKRAGFQIPHGSDPSVKPLLLTLDPVHVEFRPLAWYLFVKFANVMLLQWYEDSCNFKSDSFGDLEYLIYSPPGYDRATGPPPCVFIHGLGLGPLQYKRVITHLRNALPNRPILIPLQPHISQDIFHSRFLRPMGRKEFVEHLSDLLLEFGWVSGDENANSNANGVTMLSHSNGSYAHAWMLKEHPNMISRSCFIDPVTFCSWEGDVCYNFIYRTPTNAIELLMRYFVGSELGVANLLQRHFDWPSNSLWYEEIPHAQDPQRAIFFLGGQDAIVDASRVKSYLSARGVAKGLRFDPEGRHGQMLASHEGLSIVADWVKEDC